MQTGIPVSPISPISSHRKTISNQLIEIPGNTHRRIKSHTNPGSPNFYTKLQTPDTLNYSIYQSKGSSRSFTRLLDAAYSYFNQNNNIKFPKFIPNDPYYDLKPSISILEKEKEDLRIENSKLHLALAQAKAKGILYKNKIKSLKSYCKIMEVNSFNDISKDNLKKQQVEVRTDLKSRKMNRKLTAEPVSYRSSETEFEIIDNCSGFKHDI